MKRWKKATALFLAVFFCAAAVAPACADTQNADLVQYSQVEQLVLRNNLQVDSNELTIGSMQDENKLKRKYDGISGILSQASSSMAAVLGNPQSTVGLKTVAQGTGLTLKALSSLLDTQEDVSDDDFELAELQADLSDKQLVRTAQSLFSVYYQLQYNIQELTDSRAVLNNTVKTAQAKCDAKLGTADDVTDAKNAVTALDQNISDLQNQTKLIGYQMNQLLGRTYGNPITFGTLPRPDVDYVKKMDPEHDAESARAASLKVKICLKKRMLLDDDTTENRDKRQVQNNAAAMENEAIGASLEKQQAAIQKQQAALSLEEQKLKSVQTKQNQAQLKYNVGLLSADGLAKIKGDCQTESTAVQIASATLFWDIESYKWIVNGLPAS